MVAQLLSNEFSPKFQPLSLDLYPSTLQIEMQLCNIPVKKFGYYFPAYLLLCCQKCIVEKAGKNSNHFSSFHLLLCSRKNIMQYFTEKFQALFLVYLSTCNRKIMQHICSEIRKSDSFLAMRFTPIFNRLYFRAMIFPRGTKGITTRRIG